MSTFDCSLAIAIKQKASTSRGRHTVDVLYKKTSKQEYNTSQMSVISY